LRVSWPKIVGTGECRRYTVQKSKGNLIKSVSFHRFRISLPASQVFWLCFGWFFEIKCTQMTFDLLIKVHTRRSNIPQLIISSSRCLRRAGIFQCQQQNFIHTIYKQRNNLEILFNFSASTYKMMTSLLKYSSTYLVTSNSSKISIVQRETDE